MLAEKTLQAVCSQVAQVLREERERRGLSMTVLAQKSGLSLAMISFVEREIRNPSLETLLRMAGAMEIDLSKVIAKAMMRAAKAERR